VEVEKEIPQKNEKKFWGYTRNQWGVLAVLVVVNLCSGLAYSILAPFYPAEAEKKGVKATEYGFVFGIYELVNFILAPFLGMHMDRIGAKTTFNVGILMAASMTVLFGFIDRLQGHSSFLIASFILRIPQAIGATGVLTASFTIVAIVFTGSVSTTFAIVETIFGLGLCIGPPVGAGLFQLGGFSLTFIALGTLFLSVAPASIYILWDKDFTNRPGKSCKNRKTGVLALMRIPTVAVPLLAVVVLEICTGVLPVLLEPHLRQFNIGPVGTGLMFLLYGSVYAITAPVWGAICDRLKQPMHVTLVGTILIFIGFALIGPAPYIPLDPNLWLTAGGLVCVGLGYGANAVSSFLIALQQARFNGFADCLGTYALVSGMWTSCVAFGSFIGPSVAGILYDLMGFRKQILILLALLVILIVTLIICIMTSREQRDMYASFSAEESTPLVRNRTRARTISVSTRTRTHSLGIYGAQ
jgi:MFS family permease